MKKLLLSAVLLIFVMTGYVAGQNTVSGKVNDTAGQPLIGANVVVEGTTSGAVTDMDGNFSISTSASFPITLRISYVGYETMIIQVDNSDPVVITMSEGTLITDELIISASRRPEKLQEAPAAVSVIGSNEVSASGGAISPVRALINTPGVELQQQTGQRINLALRGSSGVFATDVFPMLDYRSLISPGLEFFDLGLAVFVA